MTLEAAASVARYSLSKDLYQVLGVPPNATSEQIKAAYRRRAQRLHPDKNPDDALAEEQFKECGEAYAVLSEPAQRLEYDMQLLSESGPVELVGGLIADLIGGSRFRRKRAGRDVRSVVHLSLEEAARGQTRDIAYTVDDLCPSCHGSGAAVGAERPCDHCHGKGELPREGLLSMPQPCPMCGGRGMRVVTACERCDGVGMLEINRKLQITLPPGVCDGDLRVVIGEGEPGLNGAAAGDLRVFVKVSHHPLLQRKGRDLTLALPVSISTVVLGGSVIVPTLNGQVRMRIPAGTQPGRVFRVRGKGAESSGDLLVTVVVEVPRGLDGSQRSLFEQLEQQMTAENLPEVAGYDAKVAALAAAGNGERS
jgi:molecular chaperone DnaJ